MKTLSEILRHCTEYLTQHKIGSARREAEDLLCDVLGCSRMDLYMQHDRPMQEAELAPCRERLVRRAKGEPLAYIHGSVHFGDLCLDVTPDVLIPRQETELLVDQIIKAEKAYGRPLKSICDVAAGSGCIGLALKKAFPDADVTLTDISPAALALAKKNAEKNQVEVKTLLGDLLEPLKGRQFDLLVCNPPYISEIEYQHLENEVLNFEPKLALVGGKTGLEYYARLAKDLEPLIIPGGRVWFEIGKGQDAEILAFFSDPVWTNHKVGLDFAQITRFFSLEKELSSLYP